MRVKTETKRQAIIDVANAAFHEAGFEGTSMSSIAARLGGSKGTLYSYFASKEELFAAVVKQIGENHVKAIFDGLDPDGDLETALQRFGEGFVHVICKPELIHAYRNVLAEAGKTEVGKLFMANGPQDGQSKLATYFQHCINLGKLRDVDANLAAHQLIALLKAEIHEPLMMAVLPPPTPAEIKQLVKRALSLFLSGYAIAQPT